MYMYVCMYYFLVLSPLNIKLSANKNWMTFEIAQMPSEL